MRSSRSWGRARLPVCVVRIRSVLRLMRLPGVGGATAPRLRPPRRFVVQAVDVDAAPDQALLVGGSLEPPEAVAHRREPARVRVGAEEGRLLVGVALEVEVRAAATAHSL